MSNTVIQIKNVSKQYRLGQVGTGTISRDLQAWWAKVRGRENPNLQIGSENKLDSVDGEYVWALRDINFEVKQGEVLGIIGKNGAGKSTLLKILSRVTTPTTGEINVKGRIASLLEVGTGFNPELTGRENIFINGAILGMTKAEIKSKLDEIIDFSGVEKYIDTPVKRYSSGMYVRLAFAVAAHLDPEILVVDEVLAVGDAEFQQKSLGKMQDLSTGGGRTVLFVSHNMAAINRICTKCLLLKNGQVNSIGNTQTIIDKYFDNDLSLLTVYKQEKNLNKAINLRKVILNPEKENDSIHIPFYEPINLRIEYEVNAEVTNSTIWFALQTSEGVIVFCSGDYDTNLTMLGKRVPGYYQADVIIPEKWLNVGKYNVIVGIACNQPVIVYERVETLCFNIEEIETPGSITMSGVRKGVLQPLFDWKTNRIQ